MIARRTFLKYLAASPLLATTSSGRMLAAELFDEGSASLADYLIASPADALDVFVIVVLLLERAFRLLAMHWPTMVAGLPGYVVGTLGAYWTIQRVAILLRGLA